VDRGAPRAVGAQAEGVDALEAADLQYRPAGEAKLAIQAGDALVRDRLHLLALALAGGERTDDAAIPQLRGRVPGQRFVGQLEVGVGKDGFAPGHRCHPRTGGKDATVAAAGTPPARAECQRPVGCMRVEPWNSPSTLKRSGRLRNCWLPSAPRPTTTHW